MFEKLGKIIEEGINKHTYQLFIKKFYMLQKKVDCHAGIGAFKDAYQISSENEKIGNVAKLCTAINYMWFISSKAENKFENINTLISKNYMCSWKRELKLENNVKLYCSDNLYTQFIKAFYEAKTAIHNIYSILQSSKISINQLDATVTTQCSKLLLFEQIIKVNNDKIDLAFTREGLLHNKKFSDFAIELAEVCNSQNNPYYITNNKLYLLDKGSFESIVSDSSSWSLKSEV